MCGARLCAVPVRGKQEAFPPSTAVHGPHPMVFPVLPQLWKKGTNEWVYVGKRQSHDSTYPLHMDIRKERNQFAHLALWKEHTPAEIASHPNTFSSAPPGAVALCTVPSIGCHFKATI